MMNAYDHCDPKGEKKRQRLWIEQAVRSLFGGCLNHSIEALFLDNAYLETTQSLPSKFYRQVHVVECLATTYQRMQVHAMTMSTRYRSRLHLYHDLVGDWIAKNPAALRRVNVLYLDYCATINGNFALGHCPKRDLHYLLQNLKQKDVVLAITVSQRYKRENKDNMTNLQELLEWHICPYFTHHQFRYHTLRKHTYQKKNKSMNMTFLLFHLQKDRTILPENALFLDTDTKYFVAIQKKTCA